MDLFLNPIFILSIALFIALVFISRFIKITAQNSLGEQDTVKVMERLNEAQQVGMIGSWEWDIDTNEIWWSDETYRIFGVERDYQPSFESNRQFIHPDDLEGYNKSFERSLQTGEALNFDARFIDKNGVQKRCSTSGRLMHNHGKRRYFVGTIMDITSRKLSEERLRESEERLRLMIEQSPLSIIIFDITGKAIQVSKSFEKLWGISFDDLKNYNILLDQQLDRIGLLSYIKKSFAGETIEMPIREYDGAETLGIGKGFKRLIRARTYPVKDDQNRVFNVVLIHEDVTEIENAKLATLKAKEDAENTARLKSRFLDIAAHELRTPVTAFSLIVQYAQKQFEKGIPVSETTLARLRTESERITRLIADLLDVSRLERNSIQLQFELKDIATQISEILEDYKLLNPDREIVFIKPENAIALEFDPVRIYQVISNFLDNACKYSPSNSPIEISISTMPGLVRVSVIDHGPGISEEQQRVLFIPFARGNTEQEIRVGGLGLGLYLSRIIVEYHGGTAGIISKLGVGSTFYFELPTSRHSDKM